MVTSSASGDSGGASLCGKSERGIDVTAERTADAVLKIAPGSGLDMTGTVLHAVLMPARYRGNAPKQSSDLQ